MSRGLTERKFKISSEVNERALPGILCFFRERYQFHIVGSFTIKVLACCYRPAFEDSIKSCQNRQKFVSFNQIPDMRTKEKIASLPANEVDSL